MECVNKNTWFESGISIGGLVCDCRKSVRVFSCFYGQYLPLLSTGIHMLISCVSSLSQYLRHILRRISKNHQPSMASSYTKTLMKPLSNKRNLPLSISPSQNFLFLQPLGLDLIAGCIRLTLKSRHTLEIEVYFCFFSKLYKTAHPFRAEHPCICASVCKYHEFVPNIKLTVGMSWPQ